jgi:hypothetical protein
MNETTKKLAVFPPVRSFRVFDHPFSQSDSLVKHKIIRYVLVTAQVQIVLIYFRYFFRHIHTISHQHSDYQHTKQKKSVHLCTIWPSCQHSVTVAELTSRESHVPTTKCHVFVCVVNTDAVVINPTQECLNMYIFAPFSHQLTNIICIFICHIVYIVFVSLKSLYFCSIFSLSVFFFSFFLFSACLHQNSDPNLDLIPYPGPDYTRSLSLPLPSLSLFSLSPL